MEEVEKVLLFLPNLQVRKLDHSEQTADVVDSLKAVVLEAEAKAGLAQLEISSLEVVEVFEHG